MHQQQGESGLTCDVKGSAASHVHMAAAGSIVGVCISWLPHTRARLLVLLSLHARLQGEEHEQQLLEQIEGMQAAAKEKEQQVSTGQPLLNPLAASPVRKPSFTPQGLGSSAWRAPSS